MNHVLRIVLLGTLCIPSMLHAQILISEIMYDLKEGSDSGREWIEVFNTSTEAVNFSTYLTLENGKKHAITASGNAILNPQSYAIIADNPEKFKVDHPSHSGLLFKSAFSLSNKGETIGLLDAKGNTIESVVYTSANGNGTGDSLQRIELVSGASFQAGIPTPGGGVPASGLTRSPPLKKSAKKSSQNNSTAVASPSLVNGFDGARPRESTQDAAASLATSGTAHADTFWYALSGSLVLSCIAAVALVWNRHLKKDEWEIEEMVESS